MTTSTFNLIAIENPDFIGVAVKHELATTQELEECIRTKETFLTELEREWTPDRIKEAYLQDKRDKYKCTVEFIKKTELDNRDSRVRGVSYKVRQTFTAKINLAYLLLKELNTQARTAKKYSVRGLVAPSYIPYIQERGFVTFLKYGYFLG